MYFNLPSTHNHILLFSNGLHSKHQYGMTFTVRPGTKNPITPWSSGES